MGNGRLLKLMLRGGHELDVRRFAVREAISEPFQVSVVALSTNAVVPFDEVIGGRATFQIDAGERGTFAWTGICNTIELLEVPAEAPMGPGAPMSAGLSTYQVSIVSDLWLATQRRNNRVFEKVRRTRLQPPAKNSIPAIVCTVLGEYEITPELKLDSEAYKEHDFRVQYGESDFDFISRLLEEVGISYYFSDDPACGSRQAATMVLADKPQTGGTGRKLTFLSSPNAKVQSFAKDVRISSLVRPGTRKRRGFDYKRPDYVDESEAMGADPLAVSEQELYEDHYVYREVARDPDGAAKGEAPDWRTEVSLESQRSEKRRVSFVSDVLGLGAGEVVEIVGHSSLDSAAEATRKQTRQKKTADGTRLLVVRSTINGRDDGEWFIGCDAVFADPKFPYRPAQRTPRPSISGVQSAIVVGPAGDEIHTERDGRVKVQLHWDREGKKDETGSCWVRVSHSWAGQRYGFITLPRIDQEVLVAFWEGNPDQPVVVGRVYNGKNVVPYELPREQTKSTWKSNSTPSAEGFNEIMFEDKKGHELVSIHAQQDLMQLVLHDADERTRRNRTLMVGKDRSTVVVGNDTMLVGRKFSVAIGDPSGGSEPTTRIEMEQGAISMTTGQATVLLDGPDITLKADGDIAITADGEVVIHGGLVKLNC